MNNKKVASILIVEDESIVALDIQHHLLRFGYSVLGPVASAGAAFEVLDQNGVDLVLMDIRIQGEIDGIEASARVREHYRRPVILLTAYADDRTLDRAKMSGPFGYIIKPFDERELRTSIEMALYRHQMEMRLTASEERYRRLFEEDLSGDFITDANGTIVDCNAAFVTLFGYMESAAIIGKSVKNLFPREHQRRFMEEKIRSGGHIRLQEFEIQRRDGSEATVLANMIGNYDQKRRLEGVHGYLIDTSAIKSLEQQLRQSQKMEAIGRMAGGIAHDFNNLLTVILGYISLIGEKTEENEPVENEIEGIRTATGRATRLTRQLLAFSRQQVLNPEVVNINSLISDAEKMIRRLINEELALTIFPEATLPYIFVDPGQLEQVLLNLVVNARDAMERGGKLTIETRNIGLPEDRGTLLGEIPAGEYCLIEIVDNGKGIPKSDLPLIFEPFFTTKPADKGTGLGLSTVYGIIKQSRGYIDVTSTEGIGTKFSLYFPLSEDDGAAATVHIPELFRYTGSETILFAEDDDEVRTVTMGVLKRAGYKLFEARNAGEALLISEDRTGEIDLLISDLVMPHMRGDKLIRRLKKIIPGLSTILISGHRYGPELNSDDYDEMLSKPFKPEELLRIVRRLLDRRNAQASQD